MANIPLQSITFPGLSDKYTTPTVDSTLTQTGAAADAKKTGDEIAELKNDLNQFPNGNYPQMGAGYANQLVSGLKKEDSTPYNFRAVPYDATLEEVKKIVGVTVAHNQLVDKSKLTSGSSGNHTVTPHDDGSITLVVSGDTSTVVAINLTANSLPSYLKVPNGHKFAVLDSNPQPNGVSYGNNYNGVSIGYNTISDKTSSSGYILLAVRLTNATEGTYTLKPQIIDLTQDFGTAIADYVYSLETATAGAGVAWLKEHFPKQFDAGYQAYDAGSMQSVSGLTEHKMVGFNQWDEEYEVGAIDASGVPSVAYNAICSKNFCRCVAGATYYMTCGKTDGGNNNRYYLGIFWYDADKNMVSREYNNNATVVAPDNAMYFKITTNTSTIIYGATYNHDICINLHWDGEKDGTYEPYKTWSYALDDSVVIRGIPKVDANGNLYYDGDEYLPDGTVNRRYGIVDLGTLNWTMGTFNDITYFTVGSSQLPDLKKPTSSTGDNNYRCGKYALVKASGVTGEFIDKSFFVYTNGVLYFRDDSYNDASAFKTGVTGVYMVYEKATPTTETASPYQATQIVDDWGTEEYVLADGAFPVPVGHETYYQNNLRAKLEMSPDSPDGDGLYVVQQESGENTYVPLASTATIQDILTRLTALENA